MGLFNKRGRPFKEEKASFSKIYEWFLRPLAKDIPNGIDELAFLEAAFDVRHRIFKRYKAVTDCHIAGQFLEVPNVKLFSRGHREVKANAELFVRTEPVLERMHVSFFGGRGEQEQTFELTGPEWKAIKRYLQEIPEVCEHSPSI